MRCIGCQARTMMLTAQAATQIAACVVFAVVCVPVAGQRDTRDTINAIRANKSKTPSKGDRARKPVIRRPASNTAKRATTSRPVVKTANKRPAAARLKPLTPAVPSADPTPTGPLRYTGVAPPAMAKPGDIWVNPRDGAELAYIPHGTFTMGDPEAATFSRGSEIISVEQRPHPVALDDYWMYRTHVTVEMYEKFCRETARPMPQAPSFNQGWQRKRQPIVNVCWNDAQAYSEWAGVKLPTEAQWERAARGPAQTVYPWGNVFDREKLWCSRSAKGDSGGASDVRGYAANGFGLYDMAGLTWQWCRDNYDPKFYSSPQAIEPNPENKALTPLRALRGGSWNHYEPRFFRTALRNGYKPEDWYPDHGFRCSVGP
jgi:formylglycine-generating enzyme